MKTQSSFIVGLLSTFGMAEMMGAADPASLGSMVILIAQCSTSLIGGIVSAVLVAWLKERWKKRNS